MKKRTGIRKHHIKLTALFASKLVLAVLGFFIGLVVGTLFDNIFISLFIAFVVAITFYLLAVLHVIDRLDF